MAAVQAYGLAPAACQPFWPGGFIPHPGLMPPFMPPAVPLAGPVRVAASAGADGIGGSRNKGAAAAVPRRLGHGNFVPRRLCLHWARNGFCRRAEACTFAHGVHELHPESQAEMAQAQVVAPPTSSAMFEGSVRPPFSSDVASSTVSDEKKDFKFNASAPVFLASPQSVSVPQCNPVPAQSVAAGSVETHGANGEVAPAAVENASATIPANAGGENPTMRESPAEREPETRQLMTPEPQQRPEAAAPALLPGVMRRQPPTIDLVEDDGLLPQRSPVFIANPSPAAAAARRFLVRCGAPLSPRALPSPTAASRVSIASLAGSPKVAMSPTAVALYPRRKSSFFGGTVGAESTRSGDTQARSPFSTVSVNSILVGSPLSHQAAQSPRFSRRSLSVEMLPQEMAPPQPIPRDMFLQARVFANRIHQGPPGLAAPSPTTAAKGLGFALPQPGLLRTEAAAAVATLPPSTRVSFSGPVTVGR